MPEQDSELDRLVAAHLDDGLGDEDLRRLHDLLRTEPAARRLLLAAAFQVSALPHLALETATRQSSPRPVRTVRASGSPWPSPRRWAAAALLVTALAAGLWWTVRPVAQDLRIDGQAQVVRADTTRPATDCPWLVVGDRVVTNDGSAVVTWTREGTRFDLDPGSTLLVEAVGGFKRLHLERGSLRADVAHQLPDSGLTIATPFGSIEVVGTRFSVKVLDHATSVAVERGSVRLHSGTASTILESGYATSMDGTAVVRPTPQVSLPPPPIAAPVTAGASGTAHLARISAADWRVGDGGEGDVVDGAIRGRLSDDGVVSRVTLPMRRPAGYLPVFRDLRCTVRVTLDRATTCSVMLMCDSPDGSSWLANLQGERQLPAGEQEVTLQLDDLHSVAGIQAPVPPGSRIVAVAIMTWAPVADLRVHFVELRSNGALQ